MKIPVERPAAEGRINRMIRWWCRSRARIDAFNQSIQGKQLSAGTGIRRAPVSATLGAMASKFVDETDRRRMVPGLVEHAAVDWLRSRRIGAIHVRAVM